MLTESQVMLKLVFVYCSRNDAILFRDFWHALCIYSLARNKTIPQEDTKMLRKLKNQKGFTLIEVLVVVIIVAILAAIAVPRYLRYVEKSRSTEAQTAITTLRKAFDIHLQTTGSTDNYTIEDAMKDANIGASTMKNWKFEVTGNPPRQYVATSQQDFPGGEGKQVIYDVVEAQFHGYGIDTWTNPESGGMEAD